MSGGVPAGWVLVPVEPTEAMVRAAYLCGDGGSPKAVYEAMIAATPTPPIEGRDADVERARITLEVFLAGYDGEADDKLVNRGHSDDLLTWGDLRTILTVLQTGATHD